MSPSHPVVQFEGQLIDRSGGIPNLRAPSSRELMEKVLAWTEFIEFVTGWDRVEHGTLTLDHVRPLPLVALGDVAHLGVEPEGIFDNFNPGYGVLMRQRGIRKFYGAVARAGEFEHVAVVSQQEFPARQDRLEVYSNVRLRDVLGIKTDDGVSVDVYHSNDWTEFASGSLWRSNDES